MKITEKIVTSVTQPQQTNVLWHNPQTGELKMFGNKGWEVVGGNPGEVGSSLGYPVVTVEDNFNIEAKPNTFYNINNNADSEVSINFNANELYATGKEGLIFFTCENFYNEGANSDILDIILISDSFGIKLITDNSLQGFKYKSILSKDLVSALGMLVDKDIVIYYSDYLQDGKDITIFIDGESLILKNVLILNKEPYLCYISLSDFGFQVDVKLPILIVEDITDSGVDLPDGYNYAYSAVMLMMECMVFTKKPYQEDDNCIIMSYLTNGSPVDTNYELVNNMNIEGSNIMKEFIFNLKSPANIVLNHPVSWNNGNTPDFTKEGICTISIVNGVGCYTFVNE